MASWPILASPHTKLMLGNAGSRIVSMARSICECRPQLQSPPHKSYKTPPKRNSITYLNSTVKFQMHVDSPTSSSAARQQRSLHHRRIQGRHRHLHPRQNTRQIFESSIPSPAHRRKQRNGSIGSPFERCRIPNQARWKTGRDFIPLSGRSTRKTLVSNREFGRKSSYRPVWTYQQTL